MTPPIGQRLITVLAALVLLAFAAVASGGGKPGDCNPNSPKKPCATIDPAEGSTLNGTVAVRATFTSAAVVAGVQFRVDDVDVGPEDTTAPYEAAWDTTGVSNGSHALTATAREPDGALTTARNDLTVENSTPDTTAPNVQVASPGGGSTVAGQVTVTGSASDDVGVAGVQFKLDGANLGGEDTDAPFEAAWNTTTSSDGQRALTAVARDAAGNSTTSAVVTVTVKNVVAPPTIDTTRPSVQLTNPAAGATVSGQLSVSANAGDNVGVTSVQFKLDGANLGAADTTAPYAVGWNTTTSSNAQHSLVAVARDAAGNTTTTAATTVTVANTTDTTAPSVQLTSPAAGANLSGQSAVSATASDNVGVTSVQFKLDGANLGAADTTAPYGVSWDTTTSSNASHALTAVARDAVGNSSTTLARSVTVANAVVASPPPTGGYFDLRPAGSWASLPSGSTCAQTVHRSSWEPRPDNYKRNHVVPDPQAVRASFAARPLSGDGTYDARWDSWLLPRVDGQFTGTTDEIFQWAACKWGIPDNVIRAAAYQESTWYQYLAYPSGRCVSYYGCGDFFNSSSAASTIFCNAIARYGYDYQRDYGSGLCPQTFSILGIKSWQAPAWGQMPDNQNGTFPFTRNSTAFAADYYAGHLRGCLEGWIFWLGDVNPAYSPGDLWGCVGNWYSGDWHDSESGWYTADVRRHYDNRVWLQPGFENDRPGCHRTYGCPGPDPM